MKKGIFIAVVLGVSVLASIVFYLLLQSGKTYDYALLFGGNALLALVTLISYALGTAASHSKSQSFARGVYSGTLLKFFVLAGGTLVYVLLNKGPLHKASFLLVGGLYFVYMALETVALQKHTRRQT